jgi:hypothetical protein
MMAGTEDEDLGFAGIERFRQDLGAAVKYLWGRMVAQLPTPGSWWLVYGGSRWMTPLKRSSAPMTLRMVFK